MFSKLVNEGVISSENSPLRGDWWDVVAAWAVNKAVH